MDWTRGPKSGLWVAQCERRGRWALAPENGGCFRGYAMADVCPKAPPPQEGETVAPRLGGELAGMLRRWWRR
jgi:hypothetical protein